MTGEGDGGWGWRVGGHWPVEEKAVGWEDDERIAGVDCAGVRLRRPRRRGPRRRRRVAARSRNPRCRGGGGESIRAGLSGHGDDASAAASAGQPPPLTPRSLAASAGESRDSGSAPRQLPPLTGA